MNDNTKIIRKALRDIFEYIENIDMVYVTNAQLQTYLERLIKQAEEQKGAKK